MKLGRSKDKWDSVRSKFIMGTLVVNMYGYHHYSKLNATLLELQWNQFYISHQIFKNLS